MSKLTIQLKDIDGNISEEKQITVSDGETLIMKYSNDMTIEQAHNCFKFLKNSLENKESLIGLPEGIKFEVLSVKPL